MPDFDEVLARFTRHGQAHILAGRDSLSPDQREELLADCGKIDFDWLAERWNEHKQAKTARNTAPVLPAPVISLPKSDADKQKNKEATDVGEQALREGKAAAFLVAGGQGTRLGFNGPKGSFPIGPLSGKSLFGWHAEQIAARGARYGAAIPWYIMTSRENDRDTKAFFEANAYFGLNKEDVFFFTQEMAPCIDLNGKLLLASPSKIAMNPNGHGGAISGIKNSGALADMQKRGIEYLSYFQVDNPLVTICDPLFIGWHILTNSDMSSKVMEKNSPAERIGAACVQDGKPAVIEYIDLDDALARETTPDGRLRFWAGSIAIHIINTAFIDRVAEIGLPWHQSLKKVPYFTGGEQIRPEKENAIKFETFVFDALPFTRNTLNLEVLREHEFAPVKNAEGTDSAVSCRKLLSDYFCEWLEKAGVRLPEQKPTVEISPLYSLDSGEFAAKTKPNGITPERSLLIG